MALLKSVASVSELEHCGGAFQLYSIYLQYIRLRAKSPIISRLGGYTNILARVVPSLARWTKVKAEIVKSQKDQLLVYCGLFIDGRLAAAAFNY